MTIKSKFTYIIVFFCLIIFTGCSIKEATKNVPDEGDLRERVVTYWGYKVREEFDKSYQFEDPFFRKKITMVNYIRSFHAGRIKWAEAKVEDIKIQDDTATVAMKIKLSIPGSSSGNLVQDAPINERWVKVDGLWYHVARKQGVSRIEN